jgi:Zn-dependent peptidase ImmA (M78 family)
MKIPRNARYKYCVNMSHEFLLREQINSFPINIETLIRKHKWASMKYSDLALKHSTTVEEIQDTFSEDGYSIYNGKNYTIAYNNTIASKDRIYFTQTHEVAHIMLGHFTTFEETILQRSTLSAADYKVLENEANCFARNVLAPAVIVKVLNISDPNTLRSLFGISLDAAKVRLTFLESDLYRLSKEQKRMQLSAFHKFLFERHCDTCGHTFASKEAKFCPICGNSKIIRGVGDMQYRDGYPVDENGRVFNCPRCGNEEIGPGAEYCRICGTCVINKCSQTEGYETDKSFVNPCGAVAHGNSRYCELCGSQTTFFKEKFLMTWMEARQLIMVREVAATAESVRKGNE